MGYIELFDKVDRSDKVIGSTSKEEAHQKGYIHRVVVAYVFNPKGELVIQQVGRNKLYDHSVGGHVTKNETYDQAMLREANEELNIKTRLKFMGKIYSDESASGVDMTRHIYAVYRSQAPDNWQFVPNDEVKSIISMPLSAVLELMKSKSDQFTPGFLATIDYYLVATHQQPV